MNMVGKVTEYLATPRKMLIGNDWVHSISGATLDIEDPATGKTIATAPAGGHADIDKAVRAARASFDAKVWRGTTGEQRAVILWKIADLMLENIDELARIEVLDNGMPQTFARLTIGNGANAFRYFAGMCTKIHGRTANVGADLEFHAFSVNEPVGVAALITPWNGPIATACNKLAPALAAGCSVVMKPAEQTVLGTLRLAELILQAGMPPGVVNIVTGFGPDAGAALVAHSSVDKISFTGSGEVGKEIVRSSANGLKRVTLELGGKSPVFIFDDADLELAVPTAAMGIFANSGQVCYAGSRLYVQSKAYDRVVAGLESAAKSMKLGSGLDSDTKLGPLISNQQRQRVLAYIESGVAEGAELVVGGGTFGTEGYFVQPTIFAQTEPQMKIVKEEIFGPVLSIMRFDSLDDIPRLGNATGYGLGAGIYTTNVSTAHKAARLLDAGNIWVNAYGRVDKALPFGGFKQSGLGRENGYEGIDAFLEKKSVYIRL